MATRSKLWPFWSSCAIRAAALAVVALPAMAASAGATAITYAGSLIDLGSGWRTSSVSKGAFDLGGTNVLGTNGYDTIGSNGHLLLPDYLSTIAANSSVYGGNSSYALIDNPITTPGATPTTSLSGTLNPFPGNNNPVVTFTFTLAGTVPGVIQVGLLEDNLDIAAYNSSAVQLSSSSAAGAPEVALTAAAYNNRNPDWIFFDITGGAAGQTFSVTNYGGPNGCGCVGAIAFDSASAVPEPGSLALLGAGVAGLVATRRPRTRLARASATSTPA